MSKFVSAIDNHTPRQFGENASVEYGYSNNLNEKIVQYFFQLVRTEETSNLERHLFEMLNFIKGNENYYFSELTVLYKIIAQTRDIVAGKGEYNLCFMELYIWYNF